MAAFLLRRLGFMILTLFLLSLIIFFAGQVVPGDPGRAVLGPFAANSAVQALDHSLGVDKPLVTRYLSWLGGLLHGNLGKSYAYQSAVAPFIKAALINSIKLAALAFVIVVPLGIVGGVVAALNYGKAADRVISVAGLSATTLPEFVSDRGHRHLRRRAEGPAGLRVSGRRRLGREPVPAPDPARDPAGARLVRLHCANGASRHDRGAQLRLRADRHVERAQALCRYPAACPAKLAAADHHRHRH